MIDTSHSVSTVTALTLYSWLLLSSYGNYYDTGDSQLILTVFTVDIYVGADRLVCKSSKQIVSRRIGKRLIWRWQEFTLLSWLLGCQWDNLYFIVDFTIKACLFRKQEEFPNSVAEGLRIDIRKGVVLIFRDFLALNW